MEGSIRGGNGESYYLPKSTSQKSNQMMPFQLENIRRPFNAKYVTFWTKRALSKMEILSIQIKETT